MVGAAPASGVLGIADYPEIPRPTRGIRTNRRNRRSVIANDQFPFLRSQVMHVGPPGAVSGIVTARASRKGPISPSALDRPMVHLLN